MGLEGQLQIWDAVLLLAIVSSRKRHFQVITLRTPRKRQVGCHPMTAQPATYSAPDEARCSAELAHISELLATAGQADLEPLRQTLYASPGS